MKSQSHASPAQRCPLAAVLDYLGDRWSLLIIRDLVIGKRRYGEFCESAEAIPTNILAARLRRLEAKGIVARVQYCERPARFEYALTEKGADLLPALQALAAFGSKYEPGVAVPPTSFFELSPEALRSKPAEGG